MPFYSWFRLFFLLYLVLPQTQGAKILYLNYLEPYIIDHETRIDGFITETHQWLQQMGMGYLNVVIEYFRDKILRQESPQQPQSAQGYATYAHDLMSRFAMPSARAPAEGGLYNMVSGFAGAMAAGKSRDATSEAASIPDSFAREQSGGTTEQKSRNIATQRERLTQILKDLEAEQQNIDLAYGSGPGQHLSASGLKVKSKSEQSFENVSYDEASGSETQVPPRKVTDRRSTSGSWMPAGVGGWFAGGGGDAPSVKKEESKGWNAAKDMVDAMAEGSSSGYDRSGR